MSQPARVTRGVSAGGQFTTSSRTEPDLSLPGKGSAWVDYSAASGPAAKWQVLTTAMEHAVNTGQVGGDDAESWLMGFEGMDSFAQARVHERVRADVAHDGPEHFGSIAFEAAQFEAAQVEERYWADAYYARAHYREDGDNPDLDEVSRQADVLRKAGREGDDA